MYGGLGDDIGVEAVAQIDGVDVITGSTARLAKCHHDGQRDLIADANQVAPSRGRRWPTIPDHCT